jgi:hypothetical protein
MWSPLFRQKNLERQRRRKSAYSDARPVVTQPSPLARFAPLGHHPPVGQGWKRVHGVL